MRVECCGANQNVNNQTERLIYARDFRFVCSLAVYYVNVWIVISSELRFLELGYILWIDEILGMIVGVCKFLHTIVITVLLDILVNICVGIIIKHISINFFVLLQRSSATINACNSYLPKL